MNILLTNDDGFDAEGIRILRTELSQDHDVYVVAPLVNQSGSSNSFKMGKMSKLLQVEQKVWALDGSPADCVLLALNSDIPGVKIDAVLSGINSDVNLGTDCIYSGTCGGARQAAIKGVRGIALSVRESGFDQGKPVFDYRAMASFARANLETLLSFISDPVELDGYSYFEEFLNLNGPSAEKYDGAMGASLAVNRYPDKIEFCRDKNGAVYSSLVGTGEQVRSYGSEDRDALVIENGKVSMTLVKSQPGFRPVDSEKARRLIF